jgi:hypothetical protein
VSDEGTELDNERSRRKQYLQTKAVSKEDSYWGLCPQAPGILSLLMPIPVGVFKSYCCGPAYSEPQSGLGPEVGAQIAFSRALSSAPSGSSVSVQIDSTQPWNEKTA